jgi:hypothetical protein
MDYNLTDEILEEFKEKVLEQGFVINDIAFTGFHSQGDGASFTGYINIKKYIEYRDLTDYKTVLELIETEQIADFVIIHRSNSRYSHEKTTYVDEIEEYDYELSQENKDMLYRLYEDLEGTRYDLSLDLYKTLELAYEEYEAYDEEDEEDEYKCEEA